MVRGLIGRQKIPRRACMILVSAALTMSVIGCHDIDLRLIIDDLSTVDPAYQWTYKPPPLNSDGMNASDRFGTSVDISHSGGYGIVGSIGESGNQGAAYIYEIDDNALTQLARIVSDVPADWDWFGFSVAISSDYAAVGAAWDDGGRGYVKLFERSDSTWSYHKTLGPGALADADARFGFSVAMSDTYLIVGAPQDGADDQGSAFVFEQDSGGTGNWGIRDEINSFAPAADEMFGYSVAITDVNALVGTQGDYFAPAERAGACYFFTRSGVTWDDVISFSSDVPAAGDFFGASVAMTDVWAVVGCPGRNEAYVYKKSGAAWAEESVFLTPEGGGDDDFGCSVSVSDSFIVVGAEQASDSLQPGFFSVYVLDVDTCSYLDTLSDETAPNDADFGHSVAESNGDLICGAPFDDVPADKSGTVKHHYYKRIK